MDLDPNEIEEKIKYYRKYLGKNCSQGTLMGICDVAGLETENWNYGLEDLVVE